MRVRQVSGFKGWCSLLASKNCKAVIAPCSGGVYPIFFVGNNKSRLIILDQNQYTVKHKDSPSFYNECINFKGARITTWHYLPSPAIVLADL